MKWFRRYIEKIATEVAEKLIKEHDMPQREDHILGEVHITGTLQVDNNVNVIGEITAYDNFKGGTAHFNGAVGLSELTIADGVLEIAGLPTTDPEILYRVWNNNGVLTISDGPT